MHTRSLPRIQLCGLQPNKYCWSHVLEVYSIVIFLFNETQHTEPDLTLLQHVFSVPVYYSVGEAIGTIG